MASTPFGICPAAPAAAMISLALPRRTFGASAKRSSVVRVRKAVAPAPTGSSTQGMPVATAFRAASDMLATQEWSSVPILTTRAADMAVNSSTSSGACTMAGEAPSARSTFAVQFMTTKFVMLCTSGLRSRSRSRWSPIMSDEIAAPMAKPCSRIATGWLSTKSVPIRYTTTRAQYAN